MKPLTQPDDIVQCCECDHVHKFSERIIEKKDFWTIYLCPNCREESYFKFKSKSGADIERIDYCPECHCYTVQTTALYDPDVPEAGKVWRCTECSESVDLYTE